MCWLTLVLGQFRERTLSTSTQEGGGLQQLTEVDKGEGGSPKVDINYGNFVNLISFGLRKVKKGDKL